MSRENVELVRMVFVDVLVDGAVVAPMFRDDTILRRRMLRPTRKCSVS